MKIWCLVFLVLFVAPNVLRAADPNVLVIITDEHNFRTLGCYREQMSQSQAEMWGPGTVVETPNIDRIAREGILCTRAYATSPVCSPCRAAMVTGFYPQNVNMPTNNEVLDRTKPTIADQLNEQGYATGFIGKWHLGGAGKPEWAPEVDGGFQFKKYMFNRGHWKKFGEKEGKPFVASQDKKGKPSYGVAGADATSFSTDFLTDRAMRFVREVDKPFCLFLSYPDPHGPNTVRPPYDHRFDTLRFLPPRTYQTGLPAPKWLGASKKHPKFRGEDMSRYFGMVQCLDDNIGRLLETLEQCGKLEDTIVLLTSDHGDLCYEHDRLNKGNAYEGSARVPLLVRYPKLIPAGKVYPEAMGTVDITPTLLGMLGMKSQAQALEGRDLSEAIDKEGGVRSESDRAIILRNAGTKPAWVAAVDGNYKLILSVNDEPWLFNREQDPDELLNFHGRPGMAEVSERLAKAMHAYGVEHEDPYVTQGKIAQSLRSVLGQRD